MGTMTRRSDRRQGVFGLRVTIATVATFVGLGLPSVAAAADTPLGATPYSGFDPSLTRAPYVTDLTQTSAYVTWATTSSSPGSMKVAPMINGTCPASVPVWSSSAIAAPDSLPGPVNQVSPGPPDTMTGRQFTVNGTSEFQSSVNLTGLTPGTSYCYSVFSGNAPGSNDLLPVSSPDQQFSTLDPVDAASTTPITFDVLADTGENYAYTSSSAGGDVSYPGQVNPNQASLFRQIGLSGADFLLNAGDTAYSGGNQSNYGDLEQTGTQPEVSNVFGPSYFPQTGGIPSFAADGNHGQNVTTLRVWPTPATTTASGGTYAMNAYTNQVDGIGGNYPDNWYAFSTGNVRVYVLDAAWADGTSAGIGSATGSLCTANPSYCRGYQADYDEHWRTSSPEYQWLKEDLAAHSGGVKFAVFHYPLRSDNATQPSDPYLQNSSANPNASTSLEALLTSNGVVMAFNGHAHTYQRIVPKQQGQLVSYVVGGGGGVLEPVQSGATCAAAQKSASVYAIGWSPSHSDPNAGTGSACGAPQVPTSAADVFSFLQVTVSGSSVTVTPTNAAGGTFDQQTYTVNPSTTITTPPPGPVPPNSQSSPAGTTTSCANHLPSGAVVGAAALTGGSGYYEVDAQGDVAAFGGAVCFGALTGIRLNKPIVGMAADPATGGYWLVASDGGIFTFHAPFYGSTGAERLNKPIVGMAAVADGSGYRLVASDGGIFTFHAPFFGSTGAEALNRPVIAGMNDNSGNGYWLVASDGGIFTFHAPFYGSAAG